MNRAALIDAAVKLVEHELGRPLDPESNDSLRFDLERPRRYRDALHQLNDDLGVDIELPMSLMDMLHERPALKAVA